MKEHKYWSFGAAVAMIGAFASGYNHCQKSHKLFAFGSLVCMIMSICSGHKLISGKLKK